jgi:hypothetical protein
MIVSRPTGAIQAGIKLMIAIFVFLCNRKRTRLNAHLCAGVEVSDGAFSATGYTKSFIAAPKLVPYISKSTKGIFPDH